MEVWIATTCMPGTASPCDPEVFSTEVEAHDWLDSTMREEWEHSAIRDEDGNAVPYPGDWQAAQEKLDDFYNRGDSYGPIWGLWLLSCHDVAEAA